MIPNERTAPERATGSADARPHAKGSLDTQLLSVNARHIVALVILGLVWGTQPSLIKALTEGGLPQVGTLGIAMVLISAVLAGVLAWRGRLLRFTSSIIVFMTIAGGSEYAGPLLVAFLVAKHIDAGLLTLIMFTAPIFTVAAAAALGAEPLDRYSFLGCVLGVIGLALIALPQDALPSPDMLPWCLAAFSVPLMYALGSVYVSKAWPPGMDAMQVAFGGAALASVLLFPFWIGPLLGGRFMGISAGECALLLALVASVVVEMVLYFYVIRHAGPVFASFGCFLSIVMGFIIGALVFSESPSLWVWTSAGFFMLSLALILLRPAKPDPGD